ncbi:aldehyde dehydrogenase, dimeric NADP-preferring isoform X1 [Hydra vulgaris]|uniref:aldehyde dehydrogenase, dimeric NADP-preferring isoform X1 n=1 Tax=Hydra vulgaris TaxID=6087 RepID=UPI001F5F753A|nr:aldehyde dehydrogenase, dimeric NADP-preferring [Hydra vulgaris]
MNLSKVVNELRQNFKNGVMQGIESRLHQLQRLNDLLDENEELILEALYKDLHKCKLESNVMELLQVRKEIGHCFQNLDEWMSPTKVSPDLLNVLNHCEIRAEPKGVVLIISPWNYPVNLLLSPLAGALAAGNVVVLKPSEVAPNVCKVFESLISRYLDEKCVQLVSGGVLETTALLKLRFDHIFFTGAPSVAKIVMRAASEHLTPVTLELGGKCPAIIDETCDFDTISKRIVWGKFCNSGQTCLAVDYILCIKKCQDALVNSLKKAIVKFYGEDPKGSKSYGRIINERHFERVCNLINSSKVVFGGNFDKSNLYISPTILSNVTADDSIMSEEIFGPLLPILCIDKIDEAIDFVNSREKPLALYVFSTNSSIVEKILKQTSSGGVCVNDALVHGAVPNLPFGGIGQSGMGAYHGKESFDVFSHKKSCLLKNQKFEFMNDIRYPPYDENWFVIRWVQSLLRPSLKRRFRFNLFHVSLLALIVACILKALAMF